jgi:hypothetical protein
MKKFFTILLRVLFIIVILCLLPLLYNFVILGQKDLGLTNSYSYCQNGIYTTYPRGQTDGSSTYYNKDGVKIGECHSWIPGDTCAQAQTLAGKCEEKGLNPTIITYFFIRLFY